MNELTVFISCNLEKNKRNFVDFVIKSFSRKGVKVIKAVGYDNATTVSIADEIRKRINNADIFAWCANSRFERTNEVDGKITKSVSDMQLIELGAAYMINKPIVAFLFDNVESNLILNHTTQYVRINETKEKTLDDSILRSIDTLIDSAIAKANENRKNYRYKTIK